MSVSNHTHYLYDVLRPQQPPLAQFGGHSFRSFYIKAAFSPDGEHILSGSSDRYGYIWSVSPCCTCRHCAHACSLTS